MLVHQWKKKQLVATPNNITSNQPPVPSVCVRVPHSPSLESGENSTPGSPVEKAHYDFATLVVREFVNPKSKSKLIFLYYQNFLFSLHARFCLDKLFWAQLKLFILFKKHSHLRSCSCHQHFRLDSLFKLNSIFTVNILTFCENIYFRHPFHPSFPSHSH